MRTILRLLTASTALSALGVGLAPSAWADGGGGAGGTSTAYVDDSGNPTAEATQVSTRPGRSSGAATNCEWRVVIANDTEMGIYDVDGTRLHSDTGRWFEKWCDGQPVMVNGGGAVPENLRSVDPATLAQQARQSVPIPSPAITTSPDADRGLYARMRTWLWVPESWWRGYSATAEAGGVSTTVSATPVRAVWSLGDGGQVVCKGPGVERRQGMSDDETYCSYVYKNASSTQQSGTYTITVTVEFAVTWTSNVGSGGALGGIARSSSRTVKVGEIQAVESQ